MLKKVLFLLPFTFCFLPFSCSNPFANQSLSMTTDPGVTEAWITLHVDGVKSGADYIVERDGATIFKGRLQSPDTVVYDSLLQPATTYTYRFFAREGGENSPALQSTLTTLGITSHIFKWEIYDFGGQKGSSAFYDVAIIDENDIWAVGEIYTADSYTYDSLGNWIDPYNAAHWDGQKWELKRILYEGGFWPIKTVFAFNKEDVWFEAYVKYDGKRFIDQPISKILVGYGINKIWGVSSNDFYVVGNGGLIAHYDGKGWMKIESGTSDNINDIYGVSYMGTDYIYCTVATLLRETERKVLRIHNLSVSDESWPFTLRNPHSVWLKSPDLLFVAGNDVVVRNRINTWKVIKDSIGKYQRCIRGNNINDLFIVGDFQLLMHYNGQSWMNYTYYGYGVHEAVDFKNDIVVIVGEVKSEAKIEMGRR